MAEQAIRDQESADAHSSVGDAPVVYTPIIREGQRLRKAAKHAAQDRLLDAIARGGSICKACQAAGVSRSTYHLWKRDDKAFATRLVSAEEDGLDLIEDRIADASEFDWRAGEAILKARRRPIWGNRVDGTINNTGSVGHTHSGEVSLIVQTPDLAWLAELLKPEGEEGPAQVAVPERPVLSARLRPEAE